MGSLAVLGWCGGAAIAARPSAAVPLFDDETLGRFDAALESASAELTEPLCRQLLALKDSLVRVGSRAARISTDEHFTHEHRMHLLQCVRRYVPDSLRPISRVPAAQRQSAAVGQGESADALLSRQLALLQAEVDRHEEALGRSAARRPAAPAALPGGQAPPLKRAWLRRAAGRCLRSGLHAPRRRAVPAGWLPVSSRSILASVKLALTRNSQVTSM